MSGSPRTTSKGSQPDPRMLDRLPTPAQIKAKNSATSWSYGGDAAETRAAPEPRVKTGGMSSIMDWNTSDGSGSGDKEGVSAGTVKATGTRRRGTTKDEARAIEDSVKGPTGAQLRARMLSGSWTPAGSVTRGDDAYSTSVAREAAPTPRKALSPASARRANVEGTFTFTEDVPVVELNLKAKEALIKKKELSSEARKRMEEAADAVSDPRAARERMQGSHFQLGVDADVPEGPQTGSARPKGMTKEEVERFSKSISVPDRSSVKEKATSTGWSLSDADGVTKPGAMPGVEAHPRGTALTAEQLAADADARAHLSRDDIRVRVGGAQWAFGDMGEDSSPIVAPQLGTPRTRGTTRDEAARSSARVHIPSSGDIAKQQRNAAWSMVDDDAASVVSTASVRKQRGTSAGEAQHLADKVSIRHSADNAKFQRNAHWTHGNTGSEAAPAASRRAAPPLAPPRSTVPWATGTGTSVDTPRTGRRRVVPPRLPTGDPTKPAPAAPAAPAPAPAPAPVPAPVPAPAAEAPAVDAAPAPAVDAAPAPAAEASPAPAAEASPAPAAKSVVSEAPSTETSVITTATEPKGKEKAASKTMHTPAKAAKAPKPPAPSVATPATSVKKAAAEPSPGSVSKSRYLKSMSSSFVFG